MTRLLFRPVAGLIVLLAALGCASSGSSKAPKSSAESDTDDPSSRVLYIAIEAVPFYIAREALEAEAPEEALFPGFHSPAVLVSSFPSTSSIAFTGILEPLGVEPAPGYEAHFFDRQKNKVVGGLSFSYFNNPFSWRNSFDWRRKNLWRRGIEKLKPIKKGAREIRDGLEAFSRSDQDRFLIYLALTDAAGHLLGPQAIKSTLSDLDGMLRDFRSEHPEIDFHTVIFSDHGMAGGEPLINVREAIIESLEKSGRRVRDRLKKPQDVVFAPFGLVSSFEVFTSPETADPAAEIVAGVPGVAFCATHEDGGWQVIGADGRAEFRRRDSSGHWSYVTNGGDPLGYTAVLEHLQARAASAATEGVEEPWYPDAWWFEETLEHFYPDALHRISRSFELVQNPASATCSLEPGYMFGAKVTAIAARLSVGKLRWTHGALHREASLGFLITDHPAWDGRPAVRFDSALRPIIDASAPRGTDPP